jgi:hypothetical protein
MRIALRTLLVAATALCATPVFADGISVPMDEARVIAFNKPVQTIFVGNPTVADVNMIDPRHAFILGKAFGSTNLIALDSNGHPVASRHVTVLGGSSLITLNRGGDQYTYACANRCEAARAPGDLKAPYDDFHGEVTAREDYAQKQADASAGPH